MIAAQLVAGRPLASFQWRNHTWVAMPTTYLFNKQASLMAIRQSWPVGVGPAGQEAFTADLQRTGRFPSTVFLTTPHSTYLKPVAELGAAGLAALLLILVAGGMTIRRLLAQSGWPRWEAAAYAGVGAAFLIEAISTDLLNCRHYWFLLAVIAARNDYSTSSVRGQYLHSSTQGGSKVNNRTGVSFSSTASHRGQLVGGGSDGGGTCPGHERKIVRAIGQVGFAERVGLIEVSGGLPGQRWTSSSTDAA
jgi:hypothetical protein